MVIQERGTMAIRRRYQIKPLELEIAPVCDASRDHSIVEEPITRSLYRFVQYFSRA